MELVKYYVVRSEPDDPSRRGKNETWKEPMKVVYINTEYVETDAGNFKTVVQKLTGKDAVVAGDSEGGRRDVEQSTAVLDRNWSIREFDRLMKELSTVDELCQTWD